jgi:hypothetical protein
VDAFGSSSNFPDTGACSSVIAYKASIADSSGGMRNRFLANLVARSNLICSQTEAQIVGTNDLINFSLGETTTILAGAGALVTGLTSAKILAGSAAITNATRSQVNEVFYENALKAAIVQKINGLRSDKLAKIVPATIDKDTGLPVTLTKFSTEDMLNAVQDYHNTCSFFAGITGLTQPGATVSSKDVAAIAAEVKSAVDSEIKGSPNAKASKGGTEAAKSN